MPAWPLAKRIAFRFACAFFPLVTLPIPYVWEISVPAVARLLHLTISMQKNGSGDTSFEWVRLLTIIALSAVITIVWSIVDRHRPRYDRGWIILRAYLRYALAGIMIGYACYKVIPTQFPPPSAERLAKRVGDMSPMGLLWTFMGLSPAYEIFTGVLEMAGALLLVARRTALLGALVCAGVLLNIVLLNFTFDVPVKIFSSELLAMALVIALPDLPRLLVFLTTAPVPRLTTDRRLELAGIAARTIFFIVVLAMAVKSSYTYHQILQARRRNAPPQKYLLTSRGFHWVNEAPFNR